VIGSAGVLRKGMEVGFEQYEELWNNVLAISTRLKQKSYKKTGLLKIENFSLLRRYCCFVRSRVGGGLRESAT
jgi:hypothetical protein